MKKIFNYLKRFFGKGVFPSCFAFTLLNPLRRLILSPEELVSRLELEKDFRVLELGPGPGYFSIEAAKNISEGELLLVDLQPEMLEKARSRLTQAGMENYSCRQGDAVDLPVADNSCDVVFLVTVLGEVSAPKICLQEVYRVLKPGGLLSITEQTGDTDYLSQSEVEELTAGTDFKFQKEYSGRGNYTVNYKKK